MWLRWSQSSVLSLYPRLCIREVWVFIGHNCNINRNLIKCNLWGRSSETIRWINTFHISQFGRLDLIICRNTERVAKRERGRNAKSMKFIKSFLIIAFLHTPVWDSKSSQHFSSFSRAWGSGFSNSAKWDEINQANSNFRMFQDGRCSVIVHTVRWKRAHIIRLLVRGDGAGGSSWLIALWLTLM